MAKLTPAPTPCQDSRHILSSRCKLKEISWQPDASRLQAEMRAVQEQSTNALELLTKVRNFAPQGEYAVGAG